MILASNSPRRKQLLEWAGLAFQQQTRPVEEHAPPGLPAPEVPEYLARQKSEAYTDWAQHYLILTADTVVVLEGERLEKPRDLSQARHMLRRLSGAEHTVVSGVCLQHAGHLRSFSQQTQVRFRKLLDAEIEAYLQKHPPLDKAGAYGIQEQIGVMGIDAISGDFYNVMGLPVSRSLVELRLAGWLRQ